MAISQRTPKYRQIRDQIQAWIASGEIRPGEQIPVEHVLASQFNASRQTVRQAIAGLVHDRILERQQGRGTFYVGAQREPLPAVREKNYTVAVITNYINSYIFPQIIRGIEQRFSADGHVMQLMSTHNDLDKERQALKTALEYPVDAVIAEATKGAYPNPNLDLYTALREKRIPVLMLNSKYDGLDASLLAVDDHAGGSVAATYLAAQGHTRIGAVLKLDEKQGILRLEGYLDALQAAGLPFRTEWTSFFTSEGWPIVCRQYAERIVSLPPVHRPTAVFCFNDVVAVKLIRELQQRDVSVPEDISLVGYDDSEMAELSHPALTTVAHPKSEMGTHAAEMILSLLAGKTRSDTGATRVVTLSPRLVVRNSVRKLHRET